MKRPKLRILAVCIAFFALVVQPASAGWFGLDSPWFATNVTQGSGYMTPTATSTATASPAPEPTRSATPTDASPTPNTTSTPSAPPNASPVPTATPRNPAIDQGESRAQESRRRKQRKKPAKEAPTPGTVTPNSRARVGKIETREDDKRRKETGGEKSVPETGTPTPGSTPGAPGGGGTAGGSDRGGAPATAGPSSNPFRDVQIGVPNFFIEKFRIPPFLLPIYQAAGTEYGVRWEILAAINEIETDYGRNLNVSYAGALGWMQFMPPTWEAYGVDANRDGVKDPYNPVDAIFSAARYLKASGADTDLRGALFAYNRANWYVDSVMTRARYIGGLPDDLVSSLTGLTQGRFPVGARATYARGERATKADTEKPSYAVESDGRRKSIKIFAKTGSPVTAANDGRVVEVGSNRRLGTFVTLQDPHGNTYTYAGLKSTVRYVPVPKRNTKNDEDEARLPRAGGRPDTAASRTTRAEARARKRAAERGAASNEVGKDRSRASTAGLAAATPDADSEQVKANAAAPTKERLFANPERQPATAAAGTAQTDARSENFSGYLQRVFGLDRSEIDMKRLKRGTRITAGTILGRVGRTKKTAAPHLLFEIRPAGRGAPRIDPKPVLDGWKLLESTAIYRADNRNPLAESEAEKATIGQVLLMSKEQLIARVLKNPNIDIYECGRRDIRSGQIDRRVLAALEFLSASGLKPTVTSMFCGRSSRYTAAENISQHMTGGAVDIGAFNGVNVTNNMGPGSETEEAVRRLATLQGNMRPDQIISLIKLPGASNTLAMSDHNDHLHIGYRPSYGENKVASRQFDAILAPNQWYDLIDRLDEIENPKVARKPSKYALPTEDEP